MKYEEDKKTRGGKQCFCARSGPAKNHIPKNVNAIGRRTIGRARHTGAPLECNFLRGDQAIENGYIYPVCTKVPTFLTAIVVYVQKEPVLCSPPVPSSN